MEFLLIADSKIKLVLTKKEIENQGIADFINGAGGREQRRRFWQLLRRAKDKVGFNFSDDKLLIQFYPTSDGGCEIFVTKLGILSPSSARLVAHSERVTLISKTEKLYLFRTLDDLIRACRSIADSVDKQKDKSSVYHSPEYGFFLLIEEYGRGDDTAEFPQLEEFGIGITASVLPYVTEHCTPIAVGNALSSVT